MKFSRIYLNRLHNQPAADDTVVVIDTLRSFTSAAVALARGARAVYPVEGVAAAQALLAELRGAVSIGAVGGGDPIAGFDFGNSPSSLPRADLTGRPVVMTTAAGVRGLQRYRPARRLYAASLVCARATAAAIRAAGADEVCFVITGEWVDRDGDEDVETTAKDLTRHFGGLDALLAADEGAFLQVPDVGPVVARCIVEFLGGSQP